MAKSLHGLRMRQGSLKVVCVKIEEMLSGEEDLLLFLSARWRFSTGIVTSHGCSAGVKNLIWIWLCY